MIAMRYCVNHMIVPWTRHNKTLLARVLLFARIVQDLHAIGFGLTGRVLGTCIVLWWQHMLVVDEGVLGEYKILIERSEDDPHSNGQSHWVWQLNPRTRRCTSPLRCSSGQSHWLRAMRWWR